MDNRGGWQLERIARALRAWWREWRGGVFLAVGLVTVMAVGSAITSHIR